MGANEPHSDGAARVRLQAGKSVVIDDTFSHRFLRDRCKAVAEACDCGFLIIHMATPLTVIERRRIENDRIPIRHRVRNEVFAEHRDRFQHPTDDEPVVRITDDQALTDWLAEERRSS